MTRDQQLEFCSVCTNRGFNPKSGIVCKLTSEVASFQGNCADYIEDEAEAELQGRTKANRAEVVKKHVNYGRYTLFALGALYALVGGYDGFLKDGYDVLEGLINLAFAAVYIGLGVWSLEKPYQALMTGLIFYGSMVLLSVVINPFSLFQGIVWKVLIVFALVASISVAKREKDKQEENSDELLDRL